MFTTLMEEKISRICNYLSKREYPENYSSSQKQNLRHLSSRFSLIDGTLYHYSKGKKRRVLRTLLETQAVFNEFHHACAAGNHNGIVKTREAISSLFYWPGMSKDIEDMLYYPGAVLPKHSDPQGPLLDPVTAGDSAPWRLWQGEGEEEIQEGEGGHCDTLTPATEGHRRVIVISNPGTLSVKEEEEKEEEEGGFKHESRESDMEAIPKLERDQEPEQHSDPDKGPAAGPEGAGRQAGTGSDGGRCAGAGSGAGFVSDAGRLRGPVTEGVLASRSLQRSHARWSDEDTLAMLSVVARLGVACQLDRKCRSSAGLWERVRLALAERGIPREAGLIRSRWTALKQMYWKEKARRRQCGATGSNSRFFKTMDVLLTRTPREPRDEDSSSGSPSLPGLVPPSPPHPRPRPIPDPGSSPSSLDSSPFARERDWRTDAQRDTEGDGARESSGWGQSALQPPLLDSGDPTTSLPYSRKKETVSHSQGPASPPEGCTAGFQERALSLLSDFLQEQRSFHAQLLQEQRELRAALERTAHTHEQSITLLRQLQGGGATPEATPPGNRGGGGVTHTGTQTTSRGHPHRQNSA
ncbi:uncharacterized protein LOC121304215 isoform X2 [Polyodon spathula]|uniref:uncharacterized protein LOC121304215 isoform X2 n=1 Tax=Polyodon spathula TaxID=7913 RepID=UPI001B7F4105|nr:uncharacterized protein LOC121304215 isoform X2 [Polyodon spathula]